MKLKNAIKYLLKTSFVQYIIALMANIYDRLVIFTSKIEYVGYENVKKSDYGLFVHWHRYILLMPFFTYPKKLKIAFLISPNRDGQLISKTAKLAHISTIWGSSGKNMGAQIMRDFKETLKTSYVGITPDGPRGPGFVMKSGCIRLSSESKKPIIPVTYRISRKITLSTWDRFIVPLPFAKVTITFHEPIYVDETENDIEFYAKKLETLLNDHEIETKTQ